MKREALLFAAGLLSFGLLWYLGSVVRPSYFPAPIAVVETAYEVTIEGDVGDETALDHLIVTLYRIAIATVLALIVSVVVGIAMGAVASVEAPIANFLPFWMSLPPLVIILFSMTLLGFDDSTIVIAVLIATAPYGIVNVWKGTNNIDDRLLEMAEVFDFGQFSVWRNIYFPAILPYLFSAGRYLFGMVWKLTLLAEVFGVSTGIGAQIRFWFGQADMTLLLAYFAVFFLTMVVIEYGILSQLEKRAFNWRTESETTV